MPALHAWIMGLRFLVMLGGIGVIRRFLLKRGGGGGGGGGRGEGEMGMAHGA